jgi:energy-coupling factor transporter ATP-binding protein EcfA2
MRPYTTLDTREEDLVAQADRKLFERRQFMYCKSALLAGARVDRIMVVHPASEKALEALDRTFQLANAVAMPQGIRIVGPTGSGKTSLIDLFALTLPKTTLFDPAHGVLRVRLMSNCTRHQIVRALLKAIDYPFPNVTTKAVDLKTSVLIEAVRSRGVRVLAVDEAHHLASARRIRHADGGTGNEATDWLREFNDETRLALVLCGTNELDHLDRVDPHLTSRLSTRVELKDFPFDVNWHAIIKSYSKQCQAFDLDNLLIGDLPIRLHGATGGNLRNLKRLLTEIVLIAVDERLLASQLNCALAKRAFDRVRGEDGIEINPFA